MSVSLRENVEQETIGRELIKQKGLSWKIKCIYLILGVVLFFSFEPIKLSRKNYNYPICYVRKFNNLKNKLGLLFDGKY